MWALGMPLRLCDINTMNTLQSLSMVWINRSCMYDYYVEAVQSPYKDFVPKVTGRFPTRELSLYSYMLMIKTRYSGFAPSERLIF